VSNISVSLAKFLSGLDLILKKYNRLLNSFDVNLLNEIADDFISLGNSLYVEFMMMSHRVLCVTALEAGLRLREKSVELRGREVKSEDLEYLWDIYNVFKLIADKIRSGEYEQGLRDMESKRKEGRSKSKRS